jgi:competence CoiA-like predicted nuclease
MKSGNGLGRVYRCPVCGAELSVIRSGNGNLAPHCCNVKMELINNRTNPVYYCKVCGSELMVINEKNGALEPICCNQIMQVRT